MGPSHNAHCLESAVKGTHSGTISRVPGDFGGDNSERNVEEWLVCYEIFVSKLKSGTL